MTRKVVIRTPHREVGVVKAAWLLEQPIEHKSHLGKRFILIALSCPVVTHFVHQPMALEPIRGPDDRAKYTPDFKVHLRDGDQLIVKVKPKVFVSANQRTLETEKRQLGIEGTKYAEFADKDLEFQL